MVNMGAKCMVCLMMFMFAGIIKAAATPNYSDALTKCILFFEGQRSGNLPPNQRMTWRKNSALKDGSDVNMDLVGGYYDAGDNVKYNFPMAFTTTMLAWSVIEFGEYMGAEDLQHAQDAIQWGSDFLLKSTNTPGVVVAEVGDPYADHNCWERPEDMDTPRTTFVINQTFPGSELAGEIAAALAASSIAFSKANPKYSSQLLQRASQVFDFANNYRGFYNASLGHWVCPFYCDFSGYMDELVWAAAWLYKATNTPNYWKFAQDNFPSLPENEVEFGWDNKHAGISVLVSQWAMNDRSSPFVRNAQSFICSIVPDSPTKYVTYSPGGLLFKPGGSNMQHTTSLSFLALVYAKYMKSSNAQQVQCGNVAVDPTKIQHIARGQVDYILGNNPLGLSYMVGYGNKYPQRIHHRGASLPSLDQKPSKLGCKDGTPYFQSKNPNPNVLVGALSGGPDSSDQYADDRSDFAHSEPTTYINAPFVGVLAYFKGSS